METVIVRERYEVVIALHDWSKAAVAQDQEAADVYLRSARLYCNGRLFASQAADAAVEALQDGRRSRNALERARYEAESQAWHRVHGLLTQIEAVQLAVANKRPIDQVSVARNGYEIEFCRIDPRNGSHSSRHYRPGGRSFARAYRILNALVDEGRGSIHVEPWAWWYRPHGIDLAIGAIAERTECA